MSSGVAFVERSHRRLSVARQCKLLGISRSSVYYRRKPTPQTDLELMAAVDRQYLETPSRLPPHAGVGPGPRALR